jgi:hypothetical protein
VTVVSVSTPFSAQRSATSRTASAARARWLRWTYVAAGGILAAHVASAEHIIKLTVRASELGPTSTSIVCNEGHVEFHSL